jgi:hypothetical protein
VIPMDRPDAYVDTVRAVRALEMFGDCASHEGGVTGKSRGRHPLKWTCSSSTSQQKCFPPWREGRHAMASHTKLSCGRCRRTGNGRQVRAGAVEARAAMRQGDGNAPAKAARQGWWPRRVAKGKGLAKARPAKARLVAQRRQGWWPSQGKAYPTPFSPTSLSVSKLTVLSKELIAAPQRVTKHHRLPRA